MMDIKLSHQAQVGHLSTKQLSIGLLNVVDDCVVGSSRPSQGGKVISMGMARFLEKPCSYNR